MGIEETSEIPVEVCMATIGRSSIDDEFNVITEHYRAEEVFKQSQLEKIQALFVDNLKPLKIRVSDETIINSMSRTGEFRELGIELIYDGQKTKRIFHREWSGWGKCGKKINPKEGLYDIEFQLSA